MAAKTDAGNPATLPAIMRYFGYDNAAQFRADWAKLTPGDKAQIKDGLTDGTLNYVMPAQA